MRLKDRTAIVTGGGQGLGEGFAVRFAEEGANVVIVDTNPVTARAVALRIEKLGRKAIAIEADLRKIANADRMARETAATFGRIDIIVNSAGVFKVASIGDTTAEVRDFQLDINLKVIFFCLHTV